MSIKTVSRIPQSTIIKGEDLFLVSQRVDGYESRYNSAAVTYDTILSSVVDTTSERVSTTYGLKENTISELSAKITTNINSINNIETDLEQIKDDVDDITSVVPQWDIMNIDSYIDPSSQQPCGSNFLKMNFDEGDYVTNTTKVDKTGNLFCYGWITAPKVIDPASAWVAIEAKMKNNTWVMLSLQPWIIGEKSSVM